MTEAAANNPVAPNGAPNTAPVDSARIPPQSEEAEMCVLGAMAIDRECIPDVIELMRPDYFYRQRHRVIYSAIIDLYELEGNQPIDLVILREKLKQDGELERIGGVDYLVSLAEAVPTAANAGYYAKIVRDAAMLRELIHISGEISKVAFEGAADADAAVEEAERLLFEVTNKNIAGSAQEMRDIIGHVFSSLEHRDGSLTGLPTGYFELNELTSGLQRNEMIVIAARPSMGKTALGLNIAEHIGADEGIPVAVFSLEMAAQQLAERMLAGRAHIDSHLLRKGSLGDGEMARLHQAAAELNEAPIFVDDTPSLTPLALRAKARRLHRQHDIRLIVIDYLQLMHSPGAESRNLEVGIISRHLKALARELEIPVIVMAQLNRGPEGREGHRPRMSDLRESGNIEQDADVVMLLHREDYYHRGEEDYEPSNTAELIVAKQRNGPTDTVKLTWLAQFTRFENQAAGVPDAFGI